MRQGSAVMATRMGPPVSMVDEKVMAVMGSAGHGLTHED